MRISESITVRKSVLKYTVVEKSFIGTYSRILQAKNFLLRFIFESRIDHVLSFQIEKIPFAYSYFHVASLSSKKLIEDELWQFS